MGVAARAENDDRQSNFLNRHVLVFRLSLILECATSAAETSCCKLSDVGSIIQCSFMLKLKKRTVQH